MPSCVVRCCRNHISQVRKNPKSIKEKPGCVMKCLSDVTFKYDFTIQKYMDQAYNIGYRATGGIVPNIPKFDRIDGYHTYFNRFIPLVKYSSTGAQGTFTGHMDIFDGITVDSSKETCSHDTFPSKLEESLKKWIHSGNRCIWFKVNIKDSYFVPALAQKGFNFHHARDDFVMMYKWLPQDSKPNLPPSCHTNLGVGAMVLNDKDQILAVSEKNYGYPHWKLPGGYVEKGEDIKDAAVREVKEETGVNAEFLSLITFRHTHKMMFGNSDIYVLMMLKALTENITIGQREVRECKWMDIEEYLNCPHVHEFNRRVIIMALDYRKKNIKLDIEKKTVKWAQFSREMNFLFIKSYN